MRNVYIFQPVGILSLPSPIYPSIFIEIVAIMLIALSIGCVLNKHIKKKWGINNVFNLIVPIFLSGLFYLRFGLGLTLIKGLILLFILIYASNSDIKKREVDDFIPVMIFITSFIEIEIKSIPLMFLSALILTIPQLLVAVSKPGSYGGADIKIMAACSFLLGLQKGLLAIISGLLIAIICTVIIRKIQKRNVKESFALIPYLAIGSILAFLL